MAIYSEKPRTSSQTHQRRSDTGFGRGSGSVARDTFHTKHSPKITPVSLDKTEEIGEIVKADIRTQRISEEGFTRYLMHWWSNKYGRPMKDPLLLSYTMEELLVEYFTHLEQAKAVDRYAQEEHDKIEDGKYDEALDWAEQEEKKEMEELARRKEQEKQKKADDEWMAEQVAKDKEQFGDDFGDDASIKF